METTLEYKGYEGSIETEEKDNTLYGKVFGIRSLISYEGNDLNELENDFRGAIDDYLLFCKDNGDQPERPFKGSFNMRIDPDELYSLNHLAAYEEISLNSYIGLSLSEELDDYLDLEVML